MENIIYVCNSKYSMYPYYCPKCGYGFARLKDINTCVCEYEFTNKNLIKVNISEEALSKLRCKL